MLEGNVPGRNIRKPGSARWTGSAVAPNSLALQAKAVPTGGADGGVQVEQDQAHTTLEPAKVSNLWNELSDFKTKIGSFLCFFTKNFYGVGYAKEDSKWKYFEHWEN